MGKFFSGFMCGAIAVMVAAAILVVANADEVPSRDECAKQHNVYKCKLIAVPVEVK